MPILRCERLESWMLSVIMGWMRGVNTAARGMPVGSDVRQWAEASHPGTDARIVALRECVICMVSLTNAMLLVTTRRPLTGALVGDAVRCAKDLIVALEALIPHASPS